MDLLNQFRCLIGKHDPQYFDHEYMEKAGIMGGVFRPYTCKRCSYASQIFYYPRDLYNESTTNRSVEPVDSNG